MKILARPPSARISEVFSSVQGEGIYAGQPQIFIRFHGCNMSCVYCDTPAGETPVESGVRSVIDLSLDSSKDKTVRAISLTGGEPLLYSDFLKALLPHLRERGYKIHLDTNGTLPDKLKEVIDLVDVVAMDIKLPSSTGEKPLWNEHREFLIIAKSKDVFVKVVVTSQTDEGDFNSAVELMGGIDRSIPFILQPASQFEDFDAVPESSTLIKWQRAAISKLKDVRIIPQLHKTRGLR